MYAATVQSRYARHANADKHVTDMGCWTCDDRYAICTAFDPENVSAYNAVHVWDTSTRKRHLVLNRHDGTICKITEHPTNPGIIITAGHDARIFIWDIRNGVPLKEFVNTNQTIGQACDIYDFCVSPSGQSIAIADIYGWWSEFGFSDTASGDKPIGALHETQFFHLDDAPVAMDADYNILDQDTQQAPHLIPQLLVTDGGTELETVARKVEDRLYSTERKLDGAKARQLASAKRETAQYKVAEKCDIWGGRGGALDDAGVGVSPEKPRMLKKRLGKRPAHDTRGMRAAELGLRDRPQPVYLSDSDRQESDEDENLSDWGQAQVRRRNRAKRQSSRESRADRAKRREQARSDAYSMMDGSDDEWGGGYGGSGRRSGGRRNTRRSTRSGGGGGATGGSGAAGDAAARRALLRTSQRLEKSKKRSWHDYLPSTWISYKMPVASPYIPQIGDELMYLRQGHAEYIAKVLAEKIHPMSKSRPWSKIEGLKDVEPCRVVDIVYRVGPPSLCTLLLEFANHPGIQISLKFRDIDDVLDFLVLKERFNRGMAQRWQVGMRFTSFANDEDGEPVAYEGTVIKTDALDTDFPHSPWRLLTVNWDDPASPDETTCPWELEATGVQSPTLPQAVAACY